MTKQYEITMLGKEIYVESYKELKEFLCKLPNHYCYVQVVVFENNRKLFTLNAIVQEIFDFLECNK
jgi:hypothetical protein